MTAVQARKLPVVGGGEGIWSFVQIGDAADATARALDNGRPGVYQIVDDEPARVADWLPSLAATIGAKPPRHVPAWLARPLIGEMGVSMMTRIHGASNAKAKQELGWIPAFASWREGFRAGLGEC